MFQRIVRQALGFSGVVACFALAACGSDPVRIDPLPVSAQVSLNLGQFTVLQGNEVTGAVEFPAAGAGGAAWLIVGQLATDIAGSNSVFSIAGQDFPPDIRARQEGGRSGGPGQRFHDMLRRREGVLARQAPMFRPLLRTPPVRTPPPVLGSKRTFKVCSDINCDQLKNVVATAQFVGSHAAIFVDDTIPSGGFSAGDLTDIGNQFDQVLYPIDTDRFGDESDIDNNTVVLVLLTDQINELIPKPDCTNSFITGFFFGADIAPGFAPQYNNGEVFYGMVPDPAGSPTRCAYSKNFVKRIMPVTFIHEFQHMISFNQHVLVRGGLDETLWLNEAMSHLAEELAGLHYDSLAVDTTATQFFLGDLYNAYSWMLNPAANALVTEEPPGTLEERGAGWLFLRYVVDQFGPTVTRSLSETSLTGAANVQAAALGTNFRSLVGRWLLTVYVSGLANFPSPSILAYSDWDFRSVFAQLHAQDPSNFPLAWPLVPDSGAGTGVAATGTLQAGTGAYVVSTQLPTASGFLLTFRGPNGGAIPSSAVPQMSVARIR